MDDARTPTISRQSENFDHIRAVERRIATLALNQHGVVTARQMIELGLTRPAIQRRVQRSGLHLIYPRVYCVGHRRLSIRGRWMAAVLAGGKGAALSHISAAELHGVWQRRNFEIHVLARATPAALVRSGIRIHRGLVQGLDVTRMDGIAVTSLSRTLIDLCSVFTPQQLASVLKQAGFLEILDVHAIHAAMGRVHRKKQIVRLEEALEIRGYGGVGTRSGLEDRLLRVLERAGVETPNVNKRYWFGRVAFEALGRETIELDMSWAEKRICVEADGTQHLEPAVRAEDEARDQVLVAAGWRVLRFTEGEVDYDESRVISAIRTALLGST